MQLMTTHPNSSCTGVPEPSEWLARVADVLGRLRLKVARAGALAANDYRLAPRLTIDADATAAWSDQLSDALAEAGFAVDVRADPGEHPHPVIVRLGDERTDLLIPVVEYQHVAPRWAAARRGDYQVD